jgi:hypothetical protein
VNVPAPDLTKFTDDGQPAEALMRFAERESRTTLVPELWLVALVLMAASAATIKVTRPHAVAAHS